MVDLTGMPELAEELVRGIGIRISIQDQIIAVFFLQQQETLVLNILFQSEFR